VGEAAMRLLAGAVGVSVVLSTVSSAIRTLECSPLDRKPTT
jgi:hypothetical protein